MKRMMAAMDRIVVDSNRQYGGEGDLRILAEDMKANGLINAINLKYITLRHPAYDGRDGSPQYEIVAGRRRHAAAKLLGWKEIEADVLEAGEEAKADAISASENINRLDMHPLDEAAIIRRLIEAGESVENLAKRLNRTKAAIWQRVQLLDLSDGIKEMFRQGSISLHAAAMLNGLDAEKQEAFCKEAKVNDYYKSGNGLPDFLVTGFIAKANNDKLYKCVAGEECQNCKKRTFYSDKELFPELEGRTSDTCLDHECYTQKWRDLLARRVKSVTGEHKDHAGAVPLVTSSAELKKTLGKSVFLGDISGAEVPVKFFRPYYPGDPEVAEKAEQGAKPCLEIELNDGGKLKVSPRYWKEPEKKQAQADKQGGAADKAFAPVARLLGLPKEEAARMEASMGNSKTSVFEDEIQRKVLDRVLKIKAEQPDDDRDIDRFLQEWLDDDADNEHIAKLFAGAGNVKALRKLSWPKLFAMLLGRLRCIDEYDIPNIANIEKIKNNNAAEWAGIPLGQFKEIYREELRALMPKPEAVKPAKKKTGKAKCRVCGCTNLNACIDKKTGQPCHWVEPDLCSACADGAVQAEKEKRAAEKPAAGTAKKAAKKPAAKARITALRGVGIVAQLPSPRSARAGGGDPVTMPGLKRAQSRIRK